MDLVNIGKTISYILRHHPESIGIKLDKHGWANVDELVYGVSLKYPGFNKSTLDEIVRTNNKQRYSYNEDETKIRANQGHSINVDVELKKVVPPVILYHGTGEQSVNSIRKHGLDPMKRLYVHLSKDIETATKVGQRHGKVHIFDIDAKAMLKDGYIFYESVNGVILTKKVPPKYLRDHR